MGPADPDTIEGNKWYGYLQKADAQSCTSLRSDVLAGGFDAWPESSYLYLAAAEACLGHWAEADRALGNVQEKPPKPSPSACGKLLVYNWVKALLDAHSSDQAFVPAFKDAPPAPPCPASSASP